ncbi:DgyrCDS6398 [Dimorphilus gyrociliatus]|uniref:DgyrCDS6398 n=1 Tax=Dimorphilus gyrociliatus TaxID=2664684 RepID=A0A7I8VQ91_9ANNE|nr:DgyrCDS6398 [Dimorphilus gyrociliatus]
MSLGYEDQDNLLEDAQDLKFGLQSYNERDDCRAGRSIINKSEIDTCIPRLQKEGNHLFKTGDNEGAILKYEKAIDILEELTLREKPRGEEWNRLDNMKIPFFLSLAQCELNLLNYNKAISWSTEVIERDCNNAKAFFRRAKAHVGAWNSVLAKLDFNKAFSLDNNISTTVNNQLTLMDKAQNGKMPKN